MTSNVIVCDFLNTHFELKSLHNVLSDFLIYLNYVLIFDIICNECFLLYYSKEMLTDSDTLFHVIFRKYSFYLFLSFFLKNTIYANIKWDSDTLFHVILRKYSFYLFLSIFFKNKIYANIKWVLLLIIYGNINHVTLILKQNEGLLTGWHFVGTHNNTCEH